MTLERQRVAEFFAQVDAELHKLASRLHGDQLVAATKTRAAIGELVRACDGHPALLRLVRALQSAPRKSRGKPFAPRITDDDVVRALRESGWNMADAAARLGCARSTIYDRARKSRAIASDTVATAVHLVSTRRR